MLFEIWMKSGKRCEHPTRDKASDSRTYPEVWNQLLCSCIDERVNVLKKYKVDWTILCCFGCRTPKLNGQTRKWVFFLFIYTEILISYSFTSGMSLWRRLRLKTICLRRITLGWAGDRSEIYVGASRGLYYPHTDFAIAIKHSNVKSAKLARMYAGEMKFLLPRSE